MVIWPCPEIPTRARLGEQDFPDSGDSQSQAGVALVAGAPFHGEAGPASTLEVGVCVQTPQGEVGKIRPGDQHAGQVAAFRAGLQALQGKGEMKSRKSRPSEQRGSRCLRFIPGLVQEDRTDARRPLLEGM